MQNTTNSLLTSSFWIGETACYGSKFSLFPDPLSVPTISG
jgi:hypothetical protein